MELLLTLPLRILLALLSRLPLGLVARLGRLGGAIGYWVDARHRRVACVNLARSFPDLSPAEVRSIALENFKRIGECYAAGIRTSSMKQEDAEKVIEIRGLNYLQDAQGQPLPKVVFAIGHFGNFEVYARSIRSWVDIPFATTYRALRQPGLNRLFQQIRERTGCRYFERRTEGGALRKALAGERIYLGLLADQNAGRKGARVPFLGRMCRASTAPAVFAQRYHCPLHTSICFRTALGRWTIEFGPEIPTRENGHLRPVDEVTADVQKVLEEAVRRDPANWFWVHNRWKGENL